MSGRFSTSQEAQRQLVSDTELIVAKSLVSLARILSQDGLQLLLQDSVKIIENTEKEHQFKIAEINALQADMDQRVQEISQNCSDMEAKARQNVQEMLAKAQEEGKVIVEQHQKQAKGLLEDAEREAHKILGEASGAVNQAKVEASQIIATATTEASQITARADAYRKQAESDVADLHQILDQRQAKIKRTLAALEEE